jgi:hypothetical protein
MKIKILIIITIFFLIGCSERTTEPDNMGFNPPRDVSWEFYQVRWGYRCTLCSRPANHSHFIIRWEMPLAGGHQITGYRVYKNNESIETVNGANNRSMIRTWESDSGWCRYNSWAGEYHVTTIFSSGESRASNKINVRRP